MDKDGWRPPGTRAYIGQRAKNAFYDYVMRKFLASGMTKAQLAKKTGRTLGQVDRILATPCYWKIETVAMLLAAISDEELLPHSAPLPHKAPAHEW